MFSFFKRKEERTVPDWANFFSPIEYNRFLTAVGSYFEKRAIPYTFDDGLIRVPKKEFGLDNLGLLNLAQTCKQSQPSRWPEIVRNHFSTLIQTHKFKTDFDNYSHDFDYVKKYIGVRIYQKAYVEHIGESIAIYKVIAKDLYAVLVFDLPTCIMNVHRSFIEKWVQNEEELFELGKANIKANCTTIPTKQKIQDFSIYTVVVDHFFSSNIIFELDQYPELVGSKGALVGCPHRHTTLIYPIENIEVIKVINTLIFFTHGMHNDGPGSISPDLYWYKDGYFEQLPYEIEEDTLKITPPDSFVELLNEMSKE